MIDRRGFIGGSAAAVAAARATVAGAQTPAEQPGTDPWLPKDVYTSSRNRAPLISREMLAGTESRQSYDNLVRGGTTAGMQGPGGISLYSSQLDGVAGALNQAVRAKSGLDPRLAELVILVSARESDSAFEWNAHERLARSAGLAPEIIDAVRYRQPATGLGEREAAIINLGREALGKRAVSAATYAAAQRLFGTETVVNMCFLMGDYFMNALLLHVFDQQLPAGTVSALPGAN